ncbi:hypothetical protein [Herbaspirillum autotrophicum]|uniref:hypothetical protein n=1 Tax=Herbaspirillum autotrophicum TaxID=180195 RepID=UPI00067AACC9|nr:hypothetical protein [Herbaspirillum autotrophicum]
MMQSRPSLRSRLCAATALCSAALLFPPSAHALFTTTYTCQAQAISVPSWPASNFTVRSDLGGEALASLLEQGAYRGFRVTCSKFAE